MSGGTSTVAVIGGINVDLLVEPYSPYKLGTSNPSRIFVSAGGVARNIAHVLAHLGLSVRLVGAIGEDPISRWVRTEIESAGVSVVGIDDHGAVGKYVSVQSGGDMATAFADLDDTERMTAEEVVAILEGKAPPNLIVVDCNLTSATLQGVIEWANEHNIPVFVEPVSVTKAQRLYDISGEIFCITPNVFEAASLGVYPINGSWGAADRSWSAIDRWSSSSLEIGHWCITAGADGAVHLHHGTVPIEEAAYSPTIRNTNGAGDAFVAGVVWRVLQDDRFHPTNWSGILRTGNAVAALALQSDSTIPRSIDSAALNAMIENY